MITAKYTGEDMSVEDIASLLRKHKQAAATLNKADIPSAPGIYVWHDLNSADSYIGKASRTLRQRIGNEHLGPRFFEARKDVFGFDDAFQISCCHLDNEKLVVDKSVFRKRIGRNHKLAPGESTLQYIRQNFAVAWLTFEPAYEGEISKIESKLITELDPALNHKGARRPKKQSKSEREAEIKRLMPKAQHGDMATQFQLGMIFKKAKRWEDAYFWLSLVSQREPNPEPSEWGIVRLTMEQLAAVERRVKEWQPTAAPPKQ